MTLTAPTSILDHLSALSDPTRARLLLALEDHELTVTELCEVLDLPQSTVSRHLKVLSDQGWVTKRRDGTRHFYGAGTLTDVEQQLWDLVGSDLAGQPVTAADRRRRESVLARRTGASAAYFAATGQAWSEVRRDLYGPRFDLLGLLGLLDPEWTIGDLGCGAGNLSATLSPFVANVIGVDASAEMLDAAAATTRHLDNVELRRGALEALPLDDGSLDAATLFLVLHHVATPSAVIAEAARVLRPGAPLLIVDMQAHEDEALAAAMGHVWQGFAPELMASVLEESGFTRVVVRALPGDPEARGPSLFTAAARRR